MEFGQEITGGAVLAAVDFEAAARALEAGVLPCCGGAGRVLRIADGTMIILDRCFDLAVYHDATKGVVVLEYASEGHVVGTALGTPTGTSPCSRSAASRSSTGGTTSTRSPYSMRLAEPRR